MTSHSEVSVRVDVYLNLPIVIIYPVPINILTYDDNYQLRVVYLEENHVYSCSVIEPLSEDVILADTGHQL